MKKSCQNNIKGASGIEFILWSCMAILFLFIPLLLFLVEYEDYQLNVMNASQIGGVVIESLQNKIQIEPLSKQQIVFSMDHMNALVTDLTKAEMREGDLMLYSVEVIEEEAANSDWRKMKIKWQFMKLPLTQIGQLVSDSSNRLPIFIEASFEFPVDGLRSKL